MDAYADARTAHADAQLEALRIDYARLQDLNGIAPLRRPATWAPSPNQLAATGRRWREERTEVLGQLAHGIKPIGASPALIDLTIPAVLKDVADDIGDLQDAVLERHAPDILPAARVPARVARIISLLPKIGTDEMLLDHVLSETRRMRARIRYALGESEEARQLAARCPVCRARSLHVLPEREMTVCANAACRCDDEMCGCHDEERPARHQWPVINWAVGA